MATVRPWQPRRTLTRRRLAAAAVLGMPAILSRTGMAAARPITFAGFGDWFHKAFDPLVLDVFRKAHPEIEVFYFPVGNSFQGLSLLREQRSFPATDVILLEAGVAARASEERLLEALDAGDAGIGLCWNARAQRLAAQAPGRFAATVPEDGTPYLATTINLVKGARQPEAARTLIAWLLGPDAQKLLVEAMFYGPVNTKVALPASSLARAGATPAMVARRIEMDWIATTTMRSQITTAWRRYKLSKH